MTESQKLTTSDGTTAFTENQGSIVVDPNLTVNGTDNYVSANVTITQGFDSEADVLAVQSSFSSSSITVVEYNSTSGVLKLNGTASASEYQQALRNVTYNNTETAPSTVDRNITFTLTTTSSPSDPNVYYNPETGHYYGYVENAGVTWESARSGAANSSYAGMSGYLATVTSSQENDFLLDKFQAAGWLGATDKASEGKWRWVTGPEGTEDGGAGRYFYNQTAAHVAWTDPYPAPPDGVPGRGTTVNGNYANWDSQRHEPDNKFPFFGGQDYAYLCSKPPGRCPSGMWMDASNTTGVGNSFTPQGYFIEYGGPNSQPNSVAVNLTASKTVTVTTAKPSDDTPPTASAAANVTTVQPGDTIGLDASGSSDNETSIARYEWDIDGNGRTDLTGPTNTTSFQNASDYTITLTVTDEGGNTDTDTVTVTVEDTTPPNGVISVDGSTTVERGETVQFTGTNSTDDYAIESFDWAFGDGSPNSTGVSPTHGYDEVGSYTVTLTVSDIAGNTDTDTVTIDVTESSRPKIYEFNATNPSGTDMNVSLTSNMTLNQITVRVYDTSELTPRANDSGALNRTLTEDDFSATRSDGNVTYTNTTTTLSADNYTLRLEQASNTSNGDGGTGQEDTVTITADTTEPSITDSNFTATNPQARDVNVSFTSNESLATAEVDIRNVTAGNNTLVATLTNFTETSNDDGTFTYTNTSPVGSDGTYEATLTKATDSAGNDGAAGQNDTVTVSTDTTAPTISNFGVSNPQSRTLNVTLNSTETLATLAVEIRNASGIVTTLTLTNFTNDGGIYWATTDVSADGDYSANLTKAEDAAGNNGASGQNDTVTVDTTGPPVPQNVTATAVAGGNITVRFDDGDEGAAQYTVYRNNTSTESGFQNLTTLTDDDSSRYTFTDSAVVEGTSYEYKVAATDGAGNEGSNSSIASATPDGTAPGISDANVTITNPQNRDLTVAVRSNESLVTVEVEVRNVTGSNDTLVATLTNFTETSNDDGTVTYTNTSSVRSDGTYEATLTKAEDAAGNDGASGQNDTVTVSTDGTAPTISNFGISNPSSRTLNVTLDSSETLAALTVEIRNASGVVTTLTLDNFTNDSGTYWATTDVAVDGDYSANLTKAADSAGNDGAAGQNDTVTVDTSGPPTPQNVTATAVAGGNITVGFDDVNGSAVQYTVYRNDTSTGDGFINITTISDDDSARYTFTDSGVTESTTYEYRVAATDDVGNEGPNSSVASATPDGTAPTVSNFSVSNPNGQDVAVSFDSTETLSSISVDLDLDGTDETTLDAADFTSSGGTYTATFYSSADGTYEATLTTAEDAVGNNGAAGQNDTVTVSTDTTAPTISNFGVSNPQSRTLNVSLDSSESLSSLTVEIRNASGVVTTLTLADFTNDSSTYWVTTDVAIEGDYSANLTRAEDAAGNDGAAGQNDTVTVSTDTTAPAFVEGYPFVNNTTTSSFDVIVRANESGPAYYVVVGDGAPEPSVSDVKNGWNASGSAAVADRNASITADTEYIFTASGLSADTDYDVYVVVEDATGNANLSSPVDASTEPATDTTAPGITDTNVTATNPQGQNLTVSVTSNESLATVEVEIRNVTAGNDTVVTTLTEFVETDNGDGTFTYTNTSTVGSDGTYETTLTKAEDAAGNDGAAGQNDTVTISTDTTAPTISNVSLANDGVGDLQLSFDSSEQLASISASVDGPSTTDVYTFDQSNFSEAGTGPYTYTLTATQAFDDGDGPYTVTIDDAVDDAGHNGGTNGQGSGLSDGYTLDTNGPEVAPQNVTATAVADGDIKVSFDDVDNGTVHYSVRRSTTSGSGYREIREIADSDQSRYTLTDTSTQENTTYYYVVVPVDSTEDDGFQSTEVSATADGIAPTVTGFTATNPSGQDVRVAFDADERLGGASAAVNVTLSGAETATLTGADFTETDNGDGTFTYTATYAGSTDGTYTATLAAAKDTAGNDGATGQQATATVSTAGSELVARATASSYVIAVNESVELRGSTSTISTGLTPTYEWRIPNASNKTGKTVTSRFDTPGEHVITLALTAGGSTVTDTLTVTVKDTTTPTARAGADRTIQEDTTVTFDATQSSDNIGITSYKWDVDGDGTTDTAAATATHTYANPGTYTATVTVSDDAGNSDTASVVVTVLGPEATVDTTSLAFGNVSVGSANTSVVQVTNTGTEPLNLTGSSFTGTTPDAFELVGTLPTIRADETRAVTVVFEPTNAGSKSATLVLATNDTDAATVTVGLNGSGVAGNLAPNRSQINFGSHQVDTTTTESITLTNTGTAPINVSAVRLTGTDADKFAIIDRGSLPSTLAPGQTHTVVAAFKPTVTGEHTAALAVDANGSTATVGLNGNGNGPDIAFPNVGESGANFPDTGKTNTSTKSITVSNYGTVPLNLTNATITGQNASAFTVANSPSTVPAGGSGTIDVRFAPGATGNYSATLTTQSNDPDEPNATVGLNGTGVAAKIDATPASLHFNGSGDTLNITVKNLATSKADLRVSQTTLTGRNPNSFDIVSGKAPFTLTPGQTKRIELTFTPTSNGTKEAQLRLISDAGNQPQIDIWLTNTRTYVVTQSVSKRFRSPNATEAVNIDANNVERGKDLLVNISRPRTRRLDVGINDLEMASNNSGQFQMNVSYGKTPIDGSTPQISQSGTSSVQYLELDHPNTKFNNTSITYQVAKSSLPANTSPGDVTIWRYSNGGWNDLGGTFVRETSTHYLYQVAPPGFSSFVVTAPTTPGSSPGSGPTSPSNDDDDDDSASGDRSPAATTATPNPTPPPASTPTPSQPGTQSEPQPQSQPPSGLDSGSGSGSGSGAQSQDTPTPTGTTDNSNLEIVSLQANRTELPQPGDVRFTATITNTGDDASSFASQIRTTMPTRRSIAFNIELPARDPFTATTGTGSTGTVWFRVDDDIVNSRNVTVPPGESRNVTFVYSFSSSGDYTIITSLNERTAAPSDREAIAAKVNVTVQATAGFSCHLFGINLGHFIVCWYWWLLLAALLLIVWLRRRMQDE